MTVRMVVNPCESGRSVTKSTAIWDQGLAGTGKGTILPAGNVLGVLHWEVRNVTIAVAIGGTDAGVFLSLPGDQK